MSSGEADSFHVVITDTSNTTHVPNGTAIDWWQPQTTGTFYTNWNTYVYVYQISCPRCKKMNWCELDKIVDCSGRIGRKYCQAKLKAVKEKVDYEINIE